MKVKFYFFLIISIFVSNIFTAEVSILELKCEIVRSYVFSIYDLSDINTLSNELATITIKKYPQLKNNFEKLKSDIENYIEEALLSESKNIAEKISILAKNLSDTEIDDIVTGGEKLDAIDKKISNIFDKQIDDICSIVIAKIKPS